MAAEQGATPGSEPRTLELGDLLAGRFRLRAQLGAGAFGTVYSALDEHEGRVVALKRLTRITGASIYRFKREFRALAEHHHPNLVRLYELFSEGDDWLFSMEVVEGERFDTWILGERSDPQDAPTLPEGALAAAASGGGAASAAGAPEPDLERLRPALAQLVAAIAELHSLGIVHRDLKPANVLVTPEGRVVLLDFGLVADADPDAQKSTLGVVMGTPTYMAPEQGLGRVTTAAADWYSLGVMLFEVLYGRPPFLGTTHDALSAKLSPSMWRLPERPAHVPEDLDALARALLAPEPDQRPTGAEIVETVGARPFVPTAAAQPPEQSLFVGRSRELRALQEAFDAADGGRPVIVQVRGQSGVGKSALLRRFTERLGSDVLVLRGRCYEREQVPYKALDGVVDSLTRHLSQLTVEEANLLVPREAHALCRLFPVFSRLRLLAEQPSRVKSWTPHEERRRGFAALREVLGRIADRRPVVVVIDDLQWGDEDSIEPITGVLAPPDPPPMLLVLSYRSEDEVRSPLLRALRDGTFGAEDGDVRDLVLAPLTDQEAQELAEKLLPADQRHRAEVVARESGGLPFFLPELVRAHRGRDSDEVGSISLEQVVRGRVSELSDPARRLLAVVAVAGRPLLRTQAARAAGLATAAEADAVEELVHEHFVRSAPSEEGVLEPYHDRVRESVVATLADDERREVHAAIAEVLSEADADPELLAEHYRLAGDLERARPVAIAAAERATDAFAFERAVALYDVAREGAPSEERRMLTARLADVYAYAGRNAEAAVAYLEAIDGAPPQEARELRRRATELMLRAGRVPEGIALARELLPEVGLDWVESRGAVLRSVLKGKLLLKLRGFGFEERELTSADDDEVTRVDLCWTLGSAFSPIDILRGADWQTQHLLRALRLGDPARVARGYALESVLLVVEAEKNQAKAARFARRAAEIATRIDDPYAVGFSFLAEAVCDWAPGRFRRAAERMEDALGILRMRDPEGAWQLAITEIWFRIRNHLMLGDFHTLRTESERAAREAEDRGDLLTLISAQGACLTYARMAEDRLEDAREMCTRPHQEWTDDAGWHFQHQEGLRANIHCDIYEGDPKRALERIHEAWPRLNASLMLRIALERAFSFWIFSTAALHAKDLREAQRWSKKLARISFPWAQAISSGVRAAVLALRGHDGAPAAYAKAAEELDAMEMTPFAAAARRRQGELLGGDEGQKLVADADALFIERGATVPEKMARVFLA